MTKCRLWLYAVVGAVAGGVFAAGPARSFVMPAFVGKALYASDAACFPLAEYGPVTNTCGTSRWYLVPMQTTNNANHTARARVAGNGGTDTECAGVALFGNGGGAHATSYSQYFSTSYGVTTMGNIFIATDETYHVECVIAPGGGILSIAD